MIKIDFKDVGQGDSILLTWQDDQQIQRYGVIDCNYEKSNPILQSINSLGCKEVEFLVISHPHVDHFSGAADLIESCINNRIKIRFLYITFGVTIAKTYTDYLSYNSQKALHRLLEVIYTHHKSFEIINTDSNTKSIMLGQDQEIAFLAPDPTEIYILSRKLGVSTAGKGSPPDLNTFSSIIEIRNGTKHALLTSDAIKSRFKAIQKSRRLKGKTFHLVQIPHHGSEGNFHLKFWETVNRIENCPAVFSVGYQTRDRLPNVETVKAIDSLKYEVHSTNSVFGINEHFSLSKNSSLPPIFGMVSTPVSRDSLTTSSRFSGNQTFML